MALDPLAPIRLGLRIGIGVLRWELRVVEHMLGLDADREPDVAPPPEPHADAPEPVSVPIQGRPEPVEERPAPPPVQAVPAPRERVADLEPEEPVHVDTEPELVAEFAEPGAEEGAGPEIHVDEPWDGYRKMAAADIRERVLVGSPEEIAVVQLYETMHRKRRTVLDAVERRSKELANAPSGR